jgi:hypothetical protein
MTAPVTMNWAGEPAEQGGPESMAFLYAEPALGQAGPDPADAAVVVEDVPEATVVSVGLRGGYGEKTFKKGSAQLDAWLAEQGVSGWRVGKIRQVHRVYMVSIVDGARPPNVVHQIAIVGGSGLVVVLN